MSGDRTKKTWRPAPMVIPASFYLFGILIGRILDIHALLPIITLCLCGFLCFWTLPRYAQLRFLSTCYSLGVAALFFTGAWSYKQQNNLVKLPSDQEQITLFGHVERLSLTKSQRFMRVTTRIVAFRQTEETIQCNKRVFIYIPISSYDSTLQAKSKILTVATVQNATPPSIFLSSSSPLSFTTVEPSFPVRWGQQLLARLRTNIRDPNAYALLSGLSIGNKEAFDPELKSAYASAGASHVLAVSGLHVGIIYAILISLCNILLPGNKRWQNTTKQLLILCAITIFAALAGFTPSVTRALLMVSLATTGKLIGRSIPTMQTLFATAILLCIIDPAVLFDIGFQLSFCAVLAILIVQPPLQNLLQPKTKSGQYIWSLICVSTAAQSGTAALAYYYFGTFPYLFLLTNLLVIPLTGVLLYLLCAWLVLCTIPVIGPVLLWTLEQTAWIMNQGVVWIGGLI